MRTAWGYDVSSAIDPIISVDDFHAATNYAYQNNPRVPEALKAASQAIRNTCGWHVTPSLTCTASPAGGAAVLRLPAAYVSAISSVKENGETVDDYEWREDGLIRRPYPWTPKWQGILVTYTAGYSVDAVQDLVEAVCSITSGVLSVSPGVSNESADGVSVSYSSSAASVANSLTSQMTSALEPYKVVSSHAA